MNHFEREMPENFKIKRYEKCTHRGTFVARILSECSSEPAILTKNTISLCRSSKNLTHDTVQST